MTRKTNAVRILDQMSIHYQLREYEVDPDDLEVIAKAYARQLFLRTLNWILKRSPSPLVIERFNSSP